MALRIQIPREEDLVLKSEGATPWEELEECLKGGRPLTPTQLQRILEKLNLEIQKKYPTSPTLKSPPKSRGRMGEVYPDPSDRDQLIKVVDPWSLIHRKVMRGALLGSSQLGFVKFLLEHLRKGFPHLTRLQQWSLPGIISVLQAGPRLDDRQEEHLFPQTRIVWELKMPRLGGWNGDEFLTKIKEGVIRISHPHRLLRRLLSQILTTLSALNQRGWFHEDPYLRNLQLIPIPAGRERVLLEVVEQGRKKKCRGLKTCWLDVDLASCHEMENAYPYDVVVFLQRAFPQWKSWVPESPWFGEMERLVHQIIELGMGPLHSLSLGGFRPRRYPGTPEYYRVIDRYLTRLQDLTP